MIYRSWKSRLVRRGGPLRFNGGFYGISLYYPGVNAAAFLLARQFQIALTSRQLIWDVPIKRVFSSRTDVRANRKSASIKKKNKQNKIVFPELIKTVNATTARTPYLGDCTTLDRDDLIPQNTRKTDRRPSHEKIRRHSTATYTRQSFPPNLTRNSVGIYQNDWTTWFFFFLPATETIPSPVLEFFTLAALAVHSNLLFMDSTIISPQASRSIRAISFLSNSTHQSQFQFHQSTHCQSSTPELI